MVVMDGRVYMIWLVDWFNIRQHDNGYVVDAAARNKLIGSGDANTMRLSVVGHLPIISANCCTVSRHLLLVFTFIYFSKQILENNLTKHQHLSSRRARSRFQTALRAFVFLLEQQISRLKQC